MSRHKLVKALDLDEELDDFEGGDASEDEVSTEDKGIQLLLYTRFEHVRLNH